MTIWKSADKCPIKKQKRHYRPCRRSKRTKADSLWWNSSMQHFCLFWEPTTTAAATTRTKAITTTTTAIKATNNKNNNEHNNNNNDRQQATNSKQQIRTRTTTNRTFTSWMQATLSFWGTLPTSITFATTLEKKGTKEEDEQSKLHKKNDERRTGSNACLLVGTIKNVFRDMH